MPSVLGLSSFLLKPAHLLVTLFPFFPILQLRLFLSFTPLWQNMTYGSLAFPYQWVFPLCLQNLKYFPSRQLCNNRLNNSCSKHLESWHFSASVEIKHRVTILSLEVCKPSSSIWQDFWELARSWTQTSLSGSLSVHRGFCRTEFTCGRWVKSSRARVSSLPFCCWKKKKITH